MAYFINGDCVSCGACESECPVSCITAGDETYVIDAEACTECGSCADVCPVSAPQKKQYPRKIKYQIRMKKGFSRPLGSLEPAERGAFFQEMNQGSGNKTIGGQRDYDNRWTTVLR